MIIVEDTVMYAQLARSVELHHLDHTAKTCRFVYNLLSCQMRTTVYGPSHDRLVSLYVQQIVCNIILLLCSIWRSATMRMRWNSCTEMLVNGNKSIFPQTILYGAVLYVLFWSNKNGEVSEVCPNEPDDSSNSARIVTCGQVRLYKTCRWKEGVFLWSVNDSYAQSVGSL